jgi:hypothetical protein
VINRAMLLFSFLERRLSISEVLFGFGMIDLLPGFGLVM